MKRLVDILLILLFLWLIVILILLGGLLVVLFDGLPIFFRQHRVGKDGKQFRVIKFRTMIVKLGNDQGYFDAGSNLRVTKVGAFLRRTKLDELPQLWNVICGEMSLVGPRPEVQKWVDVYPERWKKVHQVSPGLTDQASIIYRDEHQLLAQADDPERTYREEVLPHKLSLYEQYVDDHSLLGDLRILFQTFLVLFR